MSRIWCRILLGLSWPTIQLAYTVDNTARMLRFTTSVVKVRRTGTRIVQQLCSPAYLDFNLHIYDMTAAPTRRGNPILQPYDGDSGHQTTMKVHKSIQGFPGGWTITDSHLSPNNDRLVYFLLLVIDYLLMYAFMLQYDILLHGW